MNRLACLFHGGHGQERSAPRVNSEHRGDKEAPRPGGSSPLERVIARTSLDAPTSLLSLSRRKTPCRLHRTLNGGASADMSIPQKADQWIVFGRRYPANSPSDSP